MTENKTLDEAIGCWTNNPDGGLPAHAGNIAEITRTVRRLTTMNGNPTTLLATLRTLRKNLDSMADMTNDAIRRCIEIIASGEVQHVPKKRKRARR